MRASARNSTGSRLGKALAATRQKNGTVSTGKVQAVPFGTYPGKRSATGDACDIEALQRFQHPHFAVHVAGAAQRTVNMFEAKMLI